jgi:hypothetical protein
MENAQKAVMIGVGIFITIIIISATITITGIGQILLNQGQTKITELSSKLRSQLQAQYDQVLMNDVLVISTINKYYAEELMPVYLYPFINSDTKAALCTAKIEGEFLSENLGIDTSEMFVRDPIISEVLDGEKANLQDFSDPTKINYYINPVGKYKAVLIRNIETADVLGIAFIRYQ